MLDYNVINHDGLNISLIRKNLNPLKVFLT